MNYFGINMDCIAIMNWLTGPGLKDFWVPLMQILSPFIAASAVIFQINRNHRNNLVLETKKVKNEIESKLYAEIDEKMEAAGDLIHEAYSYVNKIYFTAVQ